MERKRAVVTGLGVITPIGLDVDTFWQSLLEGRSGIARIQSFDPDEWGLGVKIAGEIRGFDPEPWGITRREERRLDRFSQFALAAARQALAQANLKIDEDIAEEIGVTIGTGVGGLHTIEEELYTLWKKGARRVSPLLVPKMMANAATGATSIRFGCRGPTDISGTACAAGADPLGRALDWIRLERAKVVIAGGSEAAILPLSLAGFENMGALTSKFNDAPEKASRPFDKDRSGFIMSEGAGILVIEEEEFARARGAQILAELVGYGAAADAYHITAPEESGRGAMGAMRKALHDAKVGLGEVRYISAHGTSTPLNDPIEAKAIRMVFGEKLIPTIAVSAIKSTLGHLLGAAGAVAAVACVKTLETGLAPPTINLENPDPECQLKHIRVKPQQIEGEEVMCNAFGFGGHCSSLLFRKYR